VIVVAHRRNQLAQLLGTPRELGIEMDVRIRGDRLVVAHDPFEDGVDLHHWLDQYEHRLLIVNVKEEGLERHVLHQLRARGVEAFFFLDQSFPFLMRTLRGGERRCAVRVSEYESVETALALAGRVDWVWVDGFHGFPLSAGSARQLRDAGFRMCLVSPELHGREPAEIPVYRAMAEATGVQFDAVCTRQPEAWGGPALLNTQNF
jgi:hypothetical protein